MRKIFSFIVILCICSAFANSHAHYVAAINAAQNASIFHGSIVQQANIASGDEPDSLNVKKSKIIAELNAKRDSTAQDVVKSYIDKSIDEINAADSATLDSIIPMIQAKVDCCLEVESKEKAATKLKKIDHKLLSRYYTDIINAESIESAKALVSDAISVIGLRPTKNKYIKEINDKFDKTPESSRNPSDQDIIKKYIRSINKATKKDDVEKIYNQALRHIKMIKLRATLITQIFLNALTEDASLEALGVIGDIAIMIHYSNNQKEMTQLLMRALELVDNSVKMDRFIKLHNAFPLGMEEAQKYYFLKLVDQDMNAMMNDSKALNTALYKLNIAIPAYYAGGDAAVGTLGTQQKGPAIDLTDQNNRVVRLYNPKNARLIEEN